MYCERIDNSSGISLKQCHRLKTPKHAAKEQRGLLLSHAYSLTGYPDNFQH